MSEKNGKIERFDVENYRNQLAAFAPGHFILISSEFHHFMSWNKSIVLNFLIDKADKCLSLERNDGWFYYTTEDMEFDTGMDRNTQHRTLRDLEEDGYIRQKRMGMPPLRYFWINMSLINERVLKFRKRRLKELIRRKKELKAKKERHRKWRKGTSLDGVEIFPED